MIFTINFYPTEEYLPSKRHRKPRTRNVSDTMNISIKELAEDDFPVAFKIHDYQSVYEGAENYQDFDKAKGEYKMFTEEIRTYAGKLFMPVRVTHGAAISTVFESPEWIKNEFRYKVSCCSKPWNEYSSSADDIILSSNADSCRKKILKQAENYIIYDGKVWSICGEPMYLINTFGLGHNHGGTGFFIEYCYNCNIANKNYFNALERDKAIAYGKQVALSRGDTKSVDSIGKHCTIEVLMPEMVKRNPKREHGNGDEFLNSIENMICGTESVAEAGILTTLMATAH